jgi:hypothetical protein
VPAAVTLCPNPQVPVWVITSSVIEFDIEKRNIHRDGKPVTLRILRVTSYNQK